MAGLTYGVTAIWEKEHDQSCGTRESSGGKYD